jgi:hypothetical protein
MIEKDAKKLKNSIFWGKIFFMKRYKYYLLNIFSRKGESNGIGYKKISGYYTQASERGAQHKSRG